MIRIVTSAASTFYATAAAAIPVFFLAAVVQESRVPPPKEIAGFWFTYPALLISGLGEAAAFGTLAENQVHPWWQGAVIAGLMVSGVFVAARVLADLADNKLKKSVFTATLLAALGGAIYFFVKL